MTTKAQQPPPWWRRHLAAIATAVGAAVLAGLTDFVKELFKGGASILGSVVAWMGQPSGLPNGVALLAVGSVLVFVVCGIAPSVRAWWSHSRGDQSFRFLGGIYDGRLWKWDHFDEKSEPYGLRPLCSHCGADMVFGGSRVDALTIDSRRPMPLQCPDCGGREDVAPADSRKIAVLVHRDLETGAWRERQRSFETERRRVAVRSPSTAKKMLASNRPGAAPNE
jgi:hypothetical protein